jgi:hypothetical protein
MAKTHSSFTATMKSLVRSGTELFKRVSSGDLDVFSTAKFASWPVFLARQVDQTDQMSYDSKNSLALYEIEIKSWFSFRECSVPLS